MSYKQDKATIFFKYDSEKKVKSLKMWRAISLPFTTLFNKITP